MRRALLLLGVLGLVAAATPAAARPLTVVQANVGNTNPVACAPQVYKLCLAPVEARAARALRALRPDVVGLQEVLPAALCARAPSSNPANLCSRAQRPRTSRPPSQVVRLLGRGYAVRCDARFGWDCLAVRRRSGRLVRLATRPVQPACEDRGFTVNVGALRLRGRAIAVALAHPSSTDAPCRVQQLRDMGRALPASGPALLLGDWNLDPVRGRDVSAVYWRREVERRFERISGSGLTSFPLAPSQFDATGTVLDGPAGDRVANRASLDHVLVRGGLRGRCRVRRIDGGGGMDHRAQVCRVDVGRGRGRG